MGGPIYGEGFIDLKPQVGQNFESGLRSKLGSIGGLALGGAAVAGAAIAGVATRGLQQFASLQTGMNEVFTLLPGITDDAMSQMTDQVKDFSTEFGVLPDQVVPALYDSLSAGVPQDNVFGFLETAQKAAAAGATDVSTAVDGLTTTVNAFGLDAADAGAVADSMFAAVQGGKTTFGELSGALFNVAPAAASAGVGFEDVNAAVATLTSAGVPTSVATTQIRSALVELAKPGSAVASTFQDLTGTGFRDFIAQGGNVQEALGLLAGHADDTGVAVSDLFGSVEAGAAAQLLAVENADKFAAELDRQQGAAGATQAAFERMETGIGPVFNKLKAEATVALIGVGDALAPTIETVGKFALDAIPKIGAAFTTAKNIVGPVITDIANTVGPVISGIVDTIGGLVGQWQSGTGTISETTAGMRDTVGPIFEQVTGIVSSAVDAFTAIITAGTNLITGIWDRFGGGILAGIRRSIDAVVQVFRGALNVVQGVFEVFAGLFTGDWSRLWGGVQQIVSGAWNVIQGIFRLAIERVRLVWGIFTAALQTIWSGLWGKIRDVLSDAWEGIKTGVTTGISAVVGFFTALPGKIIDTIVGLHDRLLAFATEALGNFVTGLTNKVGDVTGFFAGLPIRISTALRTVITRMVGFGGDLISGFIRGIRDKAGDIIAAIRSTITDRLPGFVKNALGIQSPSKVFAALGRDTIGGFAVGIRDQAGDVIDATRRTVGRLVDAASNAGTVSPFATGPGDLAANRTANGRNGVTINNYGPVNEQLTGRTAALALRMA